MKRSYRCFTAMCCLLFALVVLAGCRSASQRVAIYPAGPVPAESDMKPYKADKAEFALPSGWVFNPQDPDKNPGAGLVGVLKKDTGGASLIMFCWGAFISKQAQPEISRKLVIDNIPDAVLVKAYEVRTPGSQSPRFEVYSGTKVQEGKKVNILGYAAWKWTYGFGCKYGIFGFAPPSGGEQFEQELVAILRSLKN